MCGVEGVDELGEVDVESGGEKVGGIELVCNDDEFGIDELDDDDDEEEEEEDDEVDDDDE